MPNSLHPQPSQDNPGLLRTDIKLKLGYPPVLMKVLIALLMLSILLGAQDFKLEKRDPAHLLFSNRVTEQTRKNAIENAGGDPASEDVVLKSLHFLNRTQKPNGSWTTQPVVMTSFALLTFLGQGRTASDEEFGETILAAITYLSDHCLGNQGKFARDFKDTRWPYERAISTYAITEAFLQCCKLNHEHIPQLTTAVEMSGQFIINQQDKSGGWHHNYEESATGHGDISLTSWHLIALRSLQLSGFKFQNLERSQRMAVAFLEGKQRPTGTIGTSPFEGDISKTAAATFALQFSLSKSKTIERALTSMEELVKFDWDTPDSDLYGHFFAAQAFFNQGGVSWANYHKLIFPSFLKKQAKNGSYPPINMGKIDAVRGLIASYATDSPEDTHYRTCLVTLILQTYYRHRR